MTLTIDDVLARLAERVWIYHWSVKDDEEIVSRGGLRPLDLVPEKSLLPNWTRFQLRQAEKYHAPRFHFGYLMGNHARIRRELLRATGLEAP